MVHNTIMVMFANTDIDSHWVFCGGVGLCYVIIKLKNLLEQKS